MSIFHWFTLFLAGVLTTAEVVLNEKINVETQAHIKNEKINVETRPKIKVNEKINVETQAHIKENEKINVETRPKIKVGEKINVETQPKTKVNEKINKETQPNIKLGEYAKVIDLDESNFEHLTQASTGGTTGDWFVLFYADWCGYCKKFEPLWNKLPEDAASAGYVVAKVNEKNNRKLLRRFNVKSFPQVIALSKGRMYKYEGDRSSISNLHKFITEDIHELEGEVIPPPPTVLDFVKSIFVDLYNEISKDLQIMWRNYKLGLFFIGSGLSTISFCLGFSIAMIFISVEKQIQKPKTE